MTTVPTFLLGLGITLVLALGVVAYLKPHLHKVLVDLCGTQERADFWTAFSNVTLVLVPLIGAPFHRPAPGSTEVFFEVTTQVKWALIGLVMAVVVLGLVISRFVPSRGSVK